MGYRSDVSFCIQIKDVEEFVALIKVDGRDMFKYFMQYMWIADYKDDNGRGRLHFHHDHWKWYEDSQAGLQDLLDMADNFDNDYKAKLARVGEEYDDHEEEWWNDDDYELDCPQVVRYIHAGFDKDKYKAVLQQGE
jgi:hypothetical protein